MLLLRKLTWCMVMVMLIHGAVEAGCPPELGDIQLEPPHAVIEYGDPVSVNCSTSSKVTRLNWTGPPEHVRWNDLTQTATWEMDTLTDWDKQMVCYVDSSDVQCNRTLPLIIYKTPDRVSISTVGHSGPMTAGEQYELQCDIQNVAPVQFLTVQWFKGETLVENIPYYNLTKTPVNLTAKLQITPSRDDVGIEYRCEAELDLVPDGPHPPLTMTSDPLNLTVHYKPAIKCSDWAPLVNTSLNTRSNTVTGNPTPRITWFQGSSSVEPSKRLSKDDSGLYEYIASNEIGNASCITKITVEYAPEFDCPPVYVEREHSLFHNCTVMASPAANVSWYKNGAKVEPPHNLTRRDSGSYRITAWNEHGSSHHDLNISVLYGPEIKSGESSVEVYEGWSVSLPCTAEGNPEPEVRWIFQNQTKATGGRQTTLNFSATSADRGEYTCTATNTIGIEIRKVTLVVKGPCPLTLQPREVVVEHGAPASAICSTTEPHLGMGWEAPQGHVDMTDSVQLITWHVPSLTVWDIKPFCFVNIKVTEQCRRDLLVTVYKTPDSVSINVMNHSGPLTEDKQYTLRCLVQNVAPVQLVTVKWFKGDTLLENKPTMGKRAQEPETLTPKLQITPSRLDIGTEYRCEAELNLGAEGPQPPPTMSSEPLTILVHYKPAIKCSDWAPLVNTSLNTRSNTVTGNPTPRITWFQGSSSVEPSKRLSKDDSGLYEYIASNEIGNASCITKITVEYAPEFDCPPVYVEREHSLFHNCTVMASPAANVSWYKDGANVEPPHNLTRRDSGSYRITAWNEHGSSHHDLNISVLYGPEIKSGESSVEVYEGWSVSLPCTAEGNPEPEVRWIFQNQIKATGGRQTTLNFSATSADRGEYTCTATNTFGIEIRKVTLVVKDYLKVIITVSLILLLVIIIFVILAVYVTRRRTGKYDVQCNGVAHSMALLNENTLG